MACIVGRRTDAGVVDGPEVGTSSRMGVISARVVRNCCQIPQNAVAEASLDGEEPLNAGLPPGPGPLAEAEPPVGAELPQADSTRARAAAGSEVASNGCRRALRVVCSMPL
jgi:hypothetical protein